MNPTAPEITPLSTASLIPYARNTRTHTEAQVQQIAASIREFGFTNPVLVKADRTIIAGHGRVQAAQLLGMESIPCLVLDYLSDTQAKALAIADNKIPLNSGWDAGLLKLEMDELREAGVDMGLLAFGDGELEALLEVNPEKPNVVEDEFVPPEVVQTQIKPGDLIELGIHRLMCGDSTDAAEIGRLMGGAQADMVLTDPPYGVSYVGKTKDALKVENDELDEASLTKLVCDAFDNAEANCRAGAYWYATVPAGPLHILFADDWKRRGILRQIMVWAKDSMVLGHSEYHYQHEPILFGWIPGDRHKNSDRTRTTLWQYDRPKANREHPTMKPVALWAQAVTDGSRGGEVVYDPFLGSGTTLIAADQLGRKCYGMEISPQYCQVIVDRYKAHCEKSGKPFECKINGEAYEG